MRPGGALAGLVDGLARAAKAAGFTAAPAATEASLVLNVVDPTRPRPFRRHSKGTFVAVLWQASSVPDDGLRATYPMLVRALASIGLCYVPGHGVLFTTMERGHSLVPDGDDLAAGVLARLEPLAAARLVIDNEVRTDLEPDEDARRMVLSVPPGLVPKRVSVDAIERWTIYRENPQARAILHVHAWLDGIEATEVNYPCGTAELAESVAAPAARSPDPGHAVVGLRNHGITATGESLTETLDRIVPRLLRQVPMS